MTVENIEVKINGIKISNKEPFTLIAGPCVVENLDHALFMADKIFKVTQKLGINFIYKSSFDKANRTSMSSERGPGLDESLKIFQSVKEKIGVSVITDVHEVSHIISAAEVVDVLQIPAFLCRQTDLLVSASKTNKPIMVKKGQFLAPWDMKNVIEKLENNGNGGILVCERGVSFGYNTLVSDFRSLPILKGFGYPVVFDATHSVQQPGGLGNKSSGQREFVPTLAKAACAIGVSAIFMESHEDPDNAPSDGPNMWPLDDLEKLLDVLKKLDLVSKNINT